MVSVYKVVAIQRKTVKRSSGAGVKTLDSTKGDAGLVLKREEWAGERKRLQLTTEEREVVKMGRLGRGEAQPGTVRLWGTIQKTLRGAWSMSHREEPGSM
jgi:hypothetical protein